MSGWICSHRNIWEHPFFSGHGVRVAIWHWLLHRAAWKETEHRIGAVKVAIKRGEVCFSQQQIQDETGATRKQVRDVLDWLVSTGKATKIGANERAKGGANVRANARTILRIEKYEEYQSKSEQGANDGARNGAARGPSKEQDNNKQDNIDGDFEAFWSIVPRKVGKGQAKKAFKAALKKTDLSKIMAGMVAYAESVSGKDQQYVAHLATWLNGERWADERPADTRRFDQKPQSEWTAKDRTEAALRWC